MSKGVMEDVQEAFAEKFQGVFDMVIRERNNYYETRPLPAAGDVDGIISNYAIINSGISGSLNLIPGPLGLVGIVPELILIINNQLKMIYDICSAYRGQKAITRETLLYVFGVALGTGGLGLGIIQGNKILIKRVSLRVFQRIITWLGGKITQSVPRQMAACRRCCCNGCLDTLFHESGGQEVEGNLHKI